MILASIFSHGFMLNAFIGGGAVAAATGLIGYFVIVRDEVFAGDALSHVAFTGALAALAFAFNQRVGLILATVVVALVLAGLRSRQLSSDVAIGTTFSWLSGLGALFLSLFTTHHSSGNAGAGPNVLFGSIFGISTSDVRTALLVSAGVGLVTLVIARPLLFASIDATVASARGIPVRTLDAVFLVLLALQISEAVQLVGTLLLLGLLSSPAAAATRLTSNPRVAMILSSALCLACVWCGLVISYVAPSLPPSFVIIALSFSVYLATTIYSRHRIS